MTDQTSLSGTFDEIPLDALLVRLAERGETGTVHVSGREASVVCLAGGAVYLATSADSAVLPAALVRGGTVSAEGWAAAAAGTPPGRSVADTLVDSGTDERRLEAAVRDHTVATVAELLAPSRGTFDVRVGRVHPFGARFRFDTADILGSAAARIDEWRRIVATIPSTALVPHVVARLPDDVDEIALDRDEWEVLAGVDGRRTVGDIIAWSAAGSFAVCRILHELITAGLVRLEDR
ncbi:MAG: DUF4388 domain-containing protein [Actinomycetota bacterium]|nr:DUF4388 domain-containing protein [Actinomycetota bacterium]